jgi:general L-amino acid transport system ATP-binding protein
MKETKAEPIIICDKVNKWYGEYHALRDVSLQVRKGEVIVIFGPSGSGKSTFIRTLNRLEDHQTGTIIVDGTELTTDVRNIEAIRRETGMVFQQFNLFPHLKVIENITLAPMWVKKQTRKDAEATALKLLERVGIKEQANKFPGQLSGGQQQRVAIARALAGSPKVLLADEPTGNLDSQMARGVMELLEDINSQGTTILMVTHDPELAARAQRNVHIMDGTVTDLTQETRHALKHAVEIA